MTMKTRCFVLAALTASAVIPAFAADNADLSAKNGRCGVDRVCLTPDANAAIKDQLAYASKRTGLERALSLETIRADIEKQRASRLSAQSQSAPPTPTPRAAPSTPDKKQVNTDFPAFGGAPKGAFPFPGQGGAGNKAPAPAFQVAGTTDGKAIVLVYGDQRVVSVGDKLPMGEVSKIGFNEVVLGNGEGDQRRYSVSW